jgi:formiminoglutamase
MKHLKAYSEAGIQKYIRKRHGETKIGNRMECLKVPDLEEGLLNTSSKFVLLGLPEDIGVRANGGRGGAHTAWQPALNNILNMQSNAFLTGKELLLLGHIDFEDMMKQADAIDFTKDSGVARARTLVSEIDNRVSQIIRLIVKCGKVPIVIGGGHNNAYGNIKGAAEGLAETGKIESAQINCINCDAHSDFRSLEGRHSGNGFSYAFDASLLNKYAVVGLHESYIPQPVLDELNRYPERIDYTLFESVFLKEEFSFKEVVKRATDFTGDTFCGIELDMDAVQNIPSSAKSPSGISANQARQFISWTANNARVAYLHIAEAAPVLSHIKTDNKTGKLIAYLVSDFIKNSKNNLTVRSII